MELIKLNEKFDLIHEYWSPKIVGELNGQYVKLAKLKGEFIWHKHDHEDELFFVVKGELRMELRDRTVLIQEKEIFIVPKGVEHKPVGEKEVWIMLFEPMSTLNTGDRMHDLTKRTLDKI